MWKSVCAIGLIYLGTMMYSIASYYHLKFRGNNWTFAKAFIIAMPLVAIEYMFSLNGNHLANKWLGMSSMNILILTMCFYFVNVWLLNRFVLKHPSSTPRELIAFVLIITAMLLSGVYSVA